MATAQHRRHASGDDDTDIFDAFTHNEPMRVRLRVLSRDEYGDLAHWCARATEAITITRDRL